jgi:hypothetical protein
MHLPTSLPHCILRPWQSSDKAALVHHADNRKVWRNLTELFPHPYTEADAEQWVAIASSPGDDTHLAIEVEGEAECHCLARLTPFASAGPEPGW